MRKLTNSFGKRMGTLIFTFVAASLFLTGCGTKNSAAPSVVENFSYRFSDSSVIFKWDSPKSNFGYVEDDSGDATTYFTGSIDVESDFYNTISVTAVKDVDTYEVSKSINAFLDGESIYSVAIAAHNSITNDSLSDIRAVEKKFVINLPKVVKSPEFSPQEKFDWDQSNDGNLTLCNFLNQGWDSRVNEVQFEGSGIYRYKPQSSPTKLTDGGCIYFYSPENFRTTKGGYLKFKIVATNAAGTTEFQGQKYVFPVLGSSAESNEVPSAPTLENPWNRTFNDRKTEELAKTVWCINQGFRSYDYSQDKCTNRIPPR